MDALKTYPIYVKGEIHLVKTREWVKETYKLTDYTLSSLIDEGAIAVYSVLPRVNESYETLKGKPVQVFEASECKNFELLYPHVIESAAKRFNKKACKFDGKFSAKKNLAALEKADDDKVAEDYTSNTVFGYASEYRLGPVWARWGTSTDAILSLYQYTVGAEAAKVRKGFGGTIGNVIAELLHLDNTDILDNSGNIDIRDKTDILDKNMACSCQFTAIFKVKR